MRLTRSLLLFLSIMVLGGVCHDAWAHKVNLFCSFEDGMLSGEGYYSGGKAAQHASIEIYSVQDNALVAKTRTDPNGTFTVTLDVPGPVKVVMYAGQGHRCECIVEKQSSASIERFDLPKDERLQRSEMEQVIEQKIKPLEMRIVGLEKQRSEPTALSVIGGIGCIAGIFLIIYLIRKTHAF